MKKRAEPALEGVICAAVAAASEAFGKFPPPPEYVIAVLATCLDIALEALIKMDPERARPVHAQVLSGLANPGPEKTATLQ